MASSKRSLRSAATSDFTNFESSSAMASGDVSFERVIPLYPKAKKLLMTYINSSRNLLITSKNEKALFVNIIGERMTRQGFWKILKSYASAAGISKDITPRSLRHSFATHLLENGAGVDELQEILGHSDISTTQIYVKYMKSKSKNALLRFHPHA